MSKEEMAAKIRTILGVDVKFEKLTRDELRLLLDRLEKPEQPAQTQEITVFPLGIVPAIAQVAQERLLRFAEQIPSIRQDLKNKINEVVDDAIRRLVSKGEQQEKKE
jgi:hypothetical protein